MALEDVKRVAHAVAVVVVVVDLLVQVVLDLLLGLGLVAVVQFRGLQEHLFERGDAHAVAVDLQALAVAVEGVEQLLEVRDLVVGQLEGELLAHVLQHDGPRHDALDGLLEALVLGALLPDQREVVAHSELVLEVHGGTQALQLALAHDADPVAQVVRLVHEVRRQQDYAVVLVVLQHFPHLASRGRVHSRRRLVQHDEFRVSDEGDPR